MGGAVAARGSEEACTPVRSAHVPSQYHTWELGSDGKTSDAYLRATQRGECQRRYRHASELIARMLEPARDSKLALPGCPPTAVDVDRWVVWWLLSWRLLKPRLIWKGRVVSNRGIGRRAGRRARRA